ACAASVRRSPPTSTPRCMTVPRLHGRTSRRPGDAYALMIFEEARRRDAMVFSIFMAIAGLLSTSRLKTHWVSPSMWIGESDVTVADRGPLSSSEISPKKSPGDILARVRPLTVTVAVPSTIRKKPSPASPSRARTASAGWCTSLADRASATRSFFESSENSGTAASILTGSCLATSRSSPASTAPAPWASGILSESLDRDHVPAREEVGPAVHLWRLDPELGEDGGDLRPVLGAVVHRLQQEQRHGHPP